MYSTYDLLQNAMESDDTAQPAGTRYNINILILIVVLDLLILFSFDSIPPYLARYIFNLAVLFLLVGVKQSSLESTMEVGHLKGGERRR